MNTSRGYPYSIPSDPADVSAAIEDLATAVDADVQARADSIHPRPAFRLGATEPISFPAWTTVTTTQRLTFQTQDELVGGAIDPVTGSVGRIVPRLPGFWWIQASMVIPRSGAVSMDQIGLTIQTGTTVLARTSTHLPPSPSDGVSNISTQAGTYFNGTTDFVEVMGTTHVATPSVLTPTMIVRNRYIYAMRMTES
jgi:hypothetical protein